MNSIFKKIKIITYRLTGSIRPLPDFLIIGVPRAGTTSLYNYLIKHPMIMPSLWKEVAFFSKHYDKGSTWYKSHFPLKLVKKSNNSNEKKILTGEASPNYLYHPSAPKRIHELIPKVRIILLLRNPVDRANSHYWQSVRKRREASSFESIIEKQMTEEPLDDEKVFLPGGGDFSNRYISGGIYSARIERFFEFFPKDQILILRSEDLYENPELIYKQTLEFLNLPEFEIKGFTKYNYHTDQKKMDNTIRQKLIDYYKPHNQRLYKLLNRDFNWDK